MRGNQVYLELDEAWELGVLGLERRDALDWGPRLRCFAPPGAIESFIRDVAADLPRFVLYGSGDFHHLAAVFLRNVSSPALSVVAFDNHPDWDIRPPRWACGGWVNRALDLENVRRVSVWGCGNFELNWPARLFRSRDRRLDVHAWSERYPPAACTRFDCMSRENWRSRFEQLAGALGGQDTYVTVDMDCLREEDAVTNWEAGLFSADDIAWAIRCLRSSANVIAGDVCGAYSRPVYERRRQRFAAEWDHPKVSPGDLSRARAINTRSLETIWPALVFTEPTRSSRPD